MKLTLSKRPGQIGPSINTRTEKHGDEDVPGVDIPVSGIFLEAEELVILLQDPDAHRALFTNARGDTQEPRFIGIAPIQIEGKLENAKVSIQVGEHSLLMKPAKVKGITLAPQVGGLTVMSCKIRGNPSANTDVLEMLNAKCRIAITGAELVEPKADEPELPLVHEGQGEDTEEEEPKRGRKPRFRADIDG